MASSRAQLLCCIYLAWGALLQGCSTAPERSPPPLTRAILPAPHSSHIQSLHTPPGQSLGSEIVIRAISLLGAPYEYGGEGPLAFDCSGLVRFVHGGLGIAVPRTAAEQFRAATPVSITNLEPGDLLFFRTMGTEISHVAIYAGSNRFVHAPKTGSPIELRMLDDNYYRPRLAGAGRLIAKK